MPTAVICDRCHQSFWRPRKYRRHACPGRPVPTSSGTVMDPAPPLPLQRAPPSPPPPASVAAPPETWQQEPLCSVSPPPPYAGSSPLLDDPTEPPSSRTPPPAPDLLAAGPTTPTYAGSPPPTESPPQRHVGIQVDGDWLPLDQVRRQVFGARRPRRRVHIHHLDPTHRRHEESDDFPYANCRQRRRLCDCVTCVGHALRVAVAPGGLFSHSPDVPGLRLATLSGLSVQKASLDDCGRLGHRLPQSPQKTWVVCGCSTCITHRNLLRAWYRATAVAAAGVSEPSAAASRRQRPPESTTDRRQHHAPRRPPRVPAAER